VGAHAVTPSIQFCCASNSDEVLNANLLRSPAVQVPGALHVERGAPSAAIAANRGLDATSADVIVFLHQDVYLPPGWDLILRARIAEVAAADPDWALLGASGVAVGGRVSGPVWTSSLGSVVGFVPLHPVPAQSFDEMLIVLRRASGLRFDPGQPGWHIYGADIVTQARAAGKGAYLVSLPCIHNDKFHGVLGADFDECYAWFRQKWASMLPVHTNVARIRRSPIHRWRERRRYNQSIDLRRPWAVDPNRSPLDYARLCGWSDLTPAAAAETT